MASRVSAQSSAHQLKITLRGTKPPVWRRLVVPSGISLGCLHEVIQRAFGWDFAHLHVFEDELGREYGDPSMDSDMWGPPRRDEESFALSEVLPREQARLDYTYDFGDDWEHRIVVEKLLPAGGGDVVRCIGGRRANPPGEDIGGLWGMYELLELIADPALDVPEHLVEWVEDLRESGYDPAVFDAAAIDKVLQHVVLRTPRDSAAQASRSARPRSAGGGFLTEEDLQYCTCGQCRVGDPVRSFLDREPDELDALDQPLEPLPIVSPPPAGDLAAAAQAVPLFVAACKLAEWCRPERPTTATDVLRPALARQAIEELELWRADEDLHDPTVRANRLGRMRSAGDLPVIDEPWHSRSTPGSSRSPRLRHARDPH